MSSRQVLDDAVVAQLLVDLRKHENAHNDALDNPVSVLWERLHTAWWNVTKRINSADPDSTSTATYNWPAWNIVQHTKPSLVFFLKKTYKAKWLSLKAGRRKVKDDPTPRLITVATRLGLGDKQEPLWLLFLYLGPDVMTSPKTTKELSAWLGKWDDVETQRELILSWIWEETLARWDTDNDEPPMPERVDICSMIRKHPPPPSPPPPSAQVSKAPRRSKRGAPQVSDDREPKRPRTTTAVEPQQEDESSPFLEVPLSELHDRSEGDESSPFLTIPLSELGNDRSEAIETALGDSSQFLTIPLSELGDRSEAVEAGLGGYFMSGGNVEGVGGDFDEFSVDLEDLSGMDEPSFQLQREQTEADIREQNEATLRERWIKALRALRRLPADASGDVNWVEGTLAV